MSAPEAYVCQLIEDAKLVVAYGARAGRLPDDTLIEAIGEAEAGLAAAKPGEVHLNKLAAALNRAVQAIAPVTPLDLGSKWRPHPMTFGRQAGVIIFAAFAILLTLATGYYTQIYFQANTILTRLIDIRSLNVQDKSERLFRFVLQNYPKVFSPAEADRNAATVDAYLRSYEDLVTLNDDIKVYLPLADAIKNRLDIVKSLDDVASFFGLPMLIAPQPPSNPTGNPLIASYLKDQSYGGPDAASAKAAPAASVQPPSSPAAAPTDPSAPALVMQTKMDQQKNLFLFIAGIPAGMSPAGMSNAQDSSLQSDPDLVTDIYFLQRSLALLSSILLPGLYGLLGATVFQMRAILNPLLLNPSMARLFFRLALGGFAGLSTALVFGPTAEKVFAQPSSYGIGTFGLAFLLGFSVDIFFAILDRLVAAASQAVAQSGKP